FDHPEFRGVARGVGVFGAEGRAERVDVAQRRREDLRLELAADREKRFFAEEILRAVDTLVLAARWIFEIERRHTEHVARALGVPRGDDRRVHVDEILALEKLVDGEREPRTHAEDGAEQIRARTEVRDLAEKLQRVAFFLERVSLVRFAENFEFAR